MSLDAFDTFLNLAGLGVNVARAVDAGIVNVPAGPSATPTQPTRDERLDRLTLICMAMWSLLQEKTGCSEAELIERVRKIDLIDGKLDGRLTMPGSATCAKCGRVSSKRQTTCMWCGAEMPQGTAFDRVL